ncbi:hypothetical protein [Dactylosporangium sp. CA-233914]|uniref:hypothetical protein n=1 Tax=Dactylosporangium sp. CA-233914 TaxID=3239934 RepID=UPI003D8BE16D
MREFLRSLAARVHDRYMTGERFTDTELAFLRHARFGELPAQVRPEDRVEIEETDPPRAWLDIGPSPEQMRATQAGAA